MSRIIQVSQLWQDGKLSIPGCRIGIDCELYQMDSLRWVWLVPSGRCFSEFEVSTTAPPASVQGVLEGAWLSTRNGNGMVLNVDSVQDVLNACEGCCGDLASVPVHYDADYAMSAIIQNAPASYCFVRTDRGDSQAFNKASMDYYGQYQVNTFTRYQRSDTQSLYCFAATAAPAFLAGDTPTGQGGGTMNTYMSNIAPVLSFGEVYSLTVLGGGTPIGGPVEGTSLQQIVELLAADPLFAATSIGIKDDRITMMTTAGQVELILSKISVGDNLFYSNIAPANEPPDLLLLTATVNGIQLLPALYGASLADIVEATAFFDDYPAAGNWYVSGDKIVLAADTGLTATLVLTGGNSPDDRQFFSNTAPTITPETTLQFSLNVDGVLVDPVVTGDSIDIILTQVDALAAYTDFGAYVKQTAPDLIRLDLVNTVPPVNCLLTLSLVEKPPFILQSNVAPALVADQQFVLNANLDLADITPPLVDTTLAGLVSQATATAGYSDKGTWSVVDDKIQLSSVTVDAGELDLTAAYLYESNDSLPLPPNPSSLGYRFYMDVDNTLLTAYVDDFLTTIVGSLNLNPDYQAFGQYVVLDGKIVLLAADTHPEVTLVLQNGYGSNQATLAGGQIFRFTPTVNSIPHGPYTSTAVSIMATILRGTSGYDGIHPVEPNDFWIGASGYMGLNSALVTGTPTLLLEAITATWQYVSNDPGAPSGGQSLALDGSINEADFTQAVAADATAMVTFLNGNAPFNLYGTWSADGVAGVKLTPNPAPSTSVQTAIAAELVMSIITTPAGFAARKATASKKATTSKKKNK